MIIYKGKDYSSMNEYINLAKFDAAYYPQEGKAHGYVEHNEISLNWCDIQDKLIRLTAKYTDCYASDLIISINSIQRCLENAQTHGVWYFGFRESGVDHDSFITQKYEYELKREYRAVWRLMLNKVDDGYTTNAVEMSLHKVEYNPYKKVSDADG